MTLMMMIANCGPVWWYAKYHGICKDLTVVILMISHNENQLLFCRYKSLNLLGHGFHSELFATGDVGGYLGETCLSTLIDMYMHETSRTLLTLNFAFFNPEVEVS